MLRLTIIIIIFVVIATDLEFVVKAIINKHIMISKNIHRFSDIKGIRNV